MSNYPKLTLKSFKEKLEAGEYKGLTGANRAIGKMKDLSEKEKDKAKGIAADFFGGAAAAPVAKKAGKKAAKKAAVRTPRAPKPVEAAPARTTKKKKKAKKSGGRQPRTAPAEAAPAVTERRPSVSPPPAESSTQASTHKVQTLGNIIGSVDAALKSIEFAQKLFPKGEAGPAAGISMNEFIGEAVNTLTRAVKALDKQVLFTQDDAPVRRPSSARKSAEASVEEAESNARPEAPVANGRLNALTPEEEEQLRLARLTQSTALAAAGLTSLPEPPAD